MCPSYKLCVVYDDLMLKHANRGELSHPERPERISSIYSMLEDYGILKRCQILLPRVATETELLLAHSQSHVSQMQSLANQPQAELQKLQENLHSVYLHESSFESASVAAGCVFQVCSANLPISSIPY